MTSELAGKHITLSNQPIYFGKSSVVDGQYMLLQDSKALVNVQYGFQHESMNCSVVFIRF